MARFSTVELKKPAYPEMNRLSFFILDVLVGMPDTQIDMLKSLKVNFS